MKITADTNLLVRAMVGDHPQQAKAAKALLARASLIVVPAPVFCELVWVMKRVYNHTPDAIAAAINALLDTENLVTDRPAVEAGLALMQRGGDFADGVIAYQGMALGGSVFASFDCVAVKLLLAQSLPAADPAGVAKMAS